MPAYDSTTIMQDLYFTTEEMQWIFSDANRVQKQMDCEAALAESEAELELIPKEAAAEIRRCSQVKYIDFHKLMADFRRTGHPFVALVRAYKDICKAGAGEYVHWGATTQDILDSATALQLKEAYDVIRRDLEKLYSVTADKAFACKDTLMAGRTNGQHALPITFGYKLAVWAFEMRDNLDRLQEGEKRAFRGQFAGAVGTLASLGDKGLQVQKAFLQKIGLAVPPIAWSVSRHHYGELLHNLALAATTLGKIGTEVYLLQKSEIGELEEVQKAGSVGSSTMPHKRNPFRAMELSTNAKLVRGCSAAMLECLELEHERDPRSMSAEIKLFTQAFSLLHASIVRAIPLLENLSVKAENMQRNLDALHGLIYSEAVMMELAQSMGRQTAHEIVHELCMEAFNRQTDLAELLLADERLKGKLDSGRLAQIMNAQNYIGQAPYFAEQAKREKDAYLAGK